MTIRLLLPILVLGALTVALPNRAFAQASGEANAMAGMSTLLLTTVGIGLSGVGIYVISSKNDDKRRAAAMYYLRNNALQVRQDICLGRGPVLQEMAVELRLGPKAGQALGTALRKQRHELLSLADPKRLTPDRAWQFFDAVRRIAKQTPKAS